MAPNVSQQKIGHIATEALFHHDTQSCEVFPMSREGIGGNQPPAITQTLGEIKNGKIRYFFEREGKNGDITAIAEQFKGSHVRNSTR